jgi:hypothetical protein
MPPNDAMHTGLDLSFTLPFFSLFLLEAQIREYCINTEC